MQVSATRSFRGAAVGGYRRRSFRADEVRVKDLAQAQREVEFPILVPTLDSFSGDDISVSMNKRTRSVEIRWRCCSGVLIRETSEPRVRFAEPHWEHRRVGGKDIHLTRKSEPTLQVVVRYAVTYVHISGELSEDAIIEMALNLGRVG